MNARQRWLETVLFGTPDKIPLYPGGGRQSTRERWMTEGMPKNVKDPPEYAYRLAGGKHKWDQFGEGFSVDERMIPQFEEKVIEKRDRSLVVQDWKGNICEISDEYSVEHLRNPIDFVTRRWIKCPVENEADWEKMKMRYDIEEPSRLPQDAREKATRLKDRSYPLGMNFPGPFWQLREWLGFENLCTELHDNPDFVREMIDFWEGFLLRLMEKTFEYVTPEYIRIDEDMAYKGFSMISPDMVREFLLPTWTRWGNLIREAGVPVYAVDSDGYVGELVDLWNEAGIRLCEPMEVAAGSDVVVFRQRFGKKMAYLGGIDKRKIAAGNGEIEEEIARLLPVIQEGGYIPGCDHGVPSDVSWDNYMHYVKLLAEATGWL